MIHIEAFRQQPVLSQNHVVVIVLRKLRVQAVARFRRFPMTDAVRTNDEVVTRVQELPGTEELSRKLRLQELLARAARAVKNQHGIRNSPLCVPRWLPQSRVVSCHSGSDSPDRNLKFLTVKSPSVVAAWFCCAAKGNAKTNDTVSVKRKEQRRHHRIIFHLYGLRICHRQLPRGRSQYLARRCRHRENDPYNPRPPAIDTVLWQRSEAQLSYVRVSAAIAMRIVAWCRSELGRPS